MTRGHGRRPVGGRLTGTAAAGAVTLARSAVRGAIEAERREALERAIADHRALVLPLPVAFVRLGGRSYTLHPHRDGRPGYACVGDL